MFALQAEH